MSELIKGFKAFTPEEWKLKVQAELAGLDYNETLVWNTAEDINVKPIYTKEDVDYSNISTIDKKEKDWKLISNFLNDSNQDYSFLYGLLISDDNFGAIKSIPEHLDLFFLAEDPDKILNEDLSSIKNLKYLELDIYGHLAKDGNWFFDSKEKSENLVKKALDNPNLEKAICIDASLYQNSGANHIQQIALALSHANEYLTQFGVESAKKIYFKVAVGSNYFFEIAKLRALRTLWNLILSDYGAEAETFIFAESSMRNKSALDVHNNVIRSTFEASSAVLGGADAVMIFPYDKLSGSSAFSEELAAKQQLLLQKESHYDKFHDPVAGSYYIEKITDLMIEKALDSFKKLESTGGFLENLFNESIQKMISASAKKEQEAFDNGDLVLIGVNKFRKEDDKPNVKPRELNERKVLLPTILPKRLAEKEELK